MRSILEKLHNVKGDGNQYTAQCPGHEDKNNSLSISKGEDGKILLFCHAGCDPEHIVDSLGVKMGDLFPSKQKEEKRIAQIYAYTDVDGNILHETIRYKPKGFSQRRPDGKGGYRYDLKGVKTVLYNLPGVIQAIKENKTIYICEGEKDCENLGKLGLTATTSPMGAGKWKNEYSDYLIDSHIVILPDNDKPGKEHAIKIAKTLTNKAASCKIIELPDLPEHGDITDFFRKHGKTKGLELFQKLIDEAKDLNYKPPLFVCLDSVQVQKVRFLWKPYIPLGKLTLLQGDPGSGKTFISANIAAAITTGKPLPYGDMQQIQGNIIYQTAEDGLGDTIKPRMMQAGADCSKVFIIDESLSSLTLMDDRIEQAIKQIQPRLLIIDPLQAYLGGKTDMHRANEVRPILAHIARLAETYDLAIILVMHLNKGGAGKSLYRGLGSIDIPAAARSVLLAGSDSNNPDTRAIVHIKSSLAPQGDSISYKLDAKGFSWGGLSQLTADDLLNYKTADNDITVIDEVKDFLSDILQDGPVLSGDVYAMAKKAGHSKRTLERARQDLNIITKRIGFGKNGQWYWQLSNNNKTLATYGENVENKGLDHTPPLATYEATFGEDNLHIPPHTPPLATYDETTTNTTFDSKTAKEKNCIKIDELFKQAGL